MLPLLERLAVIGSVRFAATCGRTWSCRFIPKAAFSGNAARTGASGKRILAALLNDVPNGSEAVRLVHTEWVVKRTLG